MDAARLIVALDSDHIGRMDGLAGVLHECLGIGFFKLGVSALMRPGGLALAEGIANKPGMSLFLDLKLHDTRDTVTRAVSRAFDIGARFVTVNADPRVMEAAMRAKTNDDECKILAVSHLSDDATSFSSSELRYAFSVADGAICSGSMIEYAREWIDKEKLIVAPGIRPHADEDGAHAYPMTPSGALQYGADYLVVGRPIWQSENPIAAAQAMLSA